MNREVLCYFNDDLTSPFGLDDLAEISKYYKKILVFDSPPLIGFGSHVEFIEKPVNWDGFSAKKLLFKNAKVILKVLWGYHLWAFWKWSGALKMLISNYHKAQHIMEYLNGKKIPINKCDFYSFWCFDITYLSWIKKLYPKAYIFVKAHGGDLYEDSPTMKLRPWLRKFEWDYSDLIMPVSKAGARHIIDRHTKNKNKVHDIYLGTDLHGYLNQIPKENEPYIFASCAHIRSIKRVHAIGEALLSTQEKIVWYHIGANNKEAEGQQFFNKMQEKLQNSFVELKYLGELSRKEIFAFYNEVPIHVFISYSETEGIPVSMMEAQSFGIPILSTDVGGCSEIVNEKTGVLVAKEIPPSSFGKVLINMTKGSFQMIERRNEIKVYWEKHFNRERNYKTMMQIRRGEKQ